MSGKIVRCPFCGCSETSHRDTLEETIISCDMCGASMPGLSYRAAMAKWEMRHGQKTDEAIDNICKILSKKT